MPTTIDTFWFVINASRVLSDRQRNMRQNVVQIQTNFHSGPGPLQGDLAATQQAIRVFGLATLQILAQVKSVYDNFPSQVQAAAIAPLPTFADLQNAYNLLFTWATNMNTAVFNTASDLDNGVASLLAAVPDTLLPF